MKRGALFYIVDFQGATSGPYRWQMLREWFALGLLVADSPICLSGEQAWQRLDAFGELLALPPSQSRPECVVPVLLDKARHLIQTSQGAFDYLRRLGCPFNNARFDAALTAYEISQLETEFPARIEPLTSLRLKMADPLNWRNQLATDAQLAIVRKKVWKVPENITGGHASAIIDPASSEQLDKLLFYGLDGVRNPIGSEDAALLIAAHERVTPQALAAFEAHVANDPPFVSPPIPGTPKQIAFLLFMGANSKVLEITKGDASELIDQLKFSMDSKISRKCEEWDRKKAKLYPHLYDGDW